MTGNDVREKYLKFFEKKGHKIIAPAPLVLKDDPTTLFTSAGMQPLVPYLLGKKHKDGKRLVDSQPCFRSQDIEEVGDNRHDTFFEMLGNWSLGDYFKKEQIPWIWEFITKELNLPAEKIHVTLFEGYKNIPKDEETYKLWRDLGVPDKRIHYYGNKNWWSISGSPDKMQENDIGGPDSEIFFEFDHIKHNKKYGEYCHPNCDCGRFIEIGNSVFIQYRKVNGELVELPQKNVDFGGGLERLTCATENHPDIFRTSLFWRIIEKIEEISGKKYEGNETPMRIIADHIKASTFLIANGITPSNKLQGYVLRRLLRRMAVKLSDLGLQLTQKTINEIAPLVRIVIKEYPMYLKNNDIINIETEIGSELEKFSRTLTKGLLEFEKYILAGKVGKDKEVIISAKDVFRLYESFGFPYELTKEEGEKRNVKIPSREEFEVELREHQELSRKSSEKKFSLK